MEYQTAVKDYEQIVFQRGVTEIMKGTEIFPFKIEKLMSKKGKKSRLGRDIKCSRKIEV